jgi:hypothetical protein
LGLALAALSARTSRKKIILFVMSRIPVEPCAEFFAKRYEPVLTTFTEDKYGKLFQVYVFVAKDSASKRDGRYQDS